jgi:2-amino-4-hydroxy-6-hydroxymethyldihydropteridine diphosphokinase
VNAVAGLETEFEQKELLRGLLAIEKEFGRDRALSIRNGPRTLDLDILLFGDLEISEPRLEIPHPRLAERAFVLVPLNEIAPDAVVPRAGTVAQLLTNLLEGSQSGANAVVRVHNDAWEVRTRL